MLHQHSIESYIAERDNGNLSARCKQIMDTLKEIGESTDRQVKDYLRLPDMNYVRPRITELIQGGFVYESGRTKCNITGKTVRIVNLTDKNELY